MAICKQTFKIFSPQIYVNYWEERRVPPTRRAAKEWRYKVLLDIPSSFTVRELCRDPEPVQAAIHALPWEVHFNPISATGKQATTAVQTQAQMVLMGGQSYRLKRNTAVTGKIFKVLLGLIQVCSAEGGDRRPTLRL